jgi:hypothetical protein
MAVYARHVWIWDCPECGKENETDSGSDECCRTCWSCGKEVELILCEGAE